MVVEGRINVPEVLEHGGHDDTVPTRPSAPLGSPFKGTVTRKIEIRQKNLRKLEMSFQGFSDAAVMLILSPLVP